MALKAILDSLDGLSDGIKTEYEEFDDDGTTRYRLSVDEVDRLVDNSGIKGALEKERLKGRLVDAIRKDFPKATDDEIRDAVKKALKTKDKPEGETDVEKVTRLEKKIREELDAEYSPIKKELDELKSKGKATSKEKQLREAAKAANVIDDDLDDVIALTRDQFDLDEKGKAYHLDADGDPSSISIEKFYADTFKKKRPKFYKAPDKSGGDAPGARKPSKTTETDDLSKLPPTERMAEHRRREAAKQKT